MHMIRVRAGPTTCPIFGPLTHSEDKKEPPLCGIVNYPEEEIAVLKWALIFFVISVVAGLFGFTGISAGSAQIAKWLFFIAIAVFAIFLVLGLMAGELLF